MVSLSGNSTLRRVGAPTVLVLCLLAVFMAYFSYWQAENLYQDLQEDNLTSFLNTSRNVLASASSEVAEGAGLTPAGIRDALMQTSLPQGTSLLVFNPAGKILHEKGSGTAAHIKDHMGYFLKQGDNASHSLITPTGETIVGMHMPSRNVFLAIVSRNTFANMPQSHNILVQVLVAVPLAIMAAFLLLLITLHYSLLKPLSRLASAMRGTIRKKDFSAKIPTGGSREIRELSTYFNQMMAALKKRDDKLRAHSENLEGQVKARTKDLEDAQEKLVMHERLAAIGEFASSIVHELRNPLSAIKMAIERLNMQARSEKNKRSLELARKEVHRLDDMLRGILDFAARRPSNIEPLPVKDILREMAPHLVAAEDAHKITISQPRPKSTTRVMADKAKLGQALLNVVKNAAECAPENSRVEIKCVTTGETVVLKVSNQGAPIPAGVKSRLFEPFYTTKKGGTRLGLPTSKKLMEEMDGA